MTTPEAEYDGLSDDDRGDRAWARALLPAAARHMALELAGVIIAGLITFTTMTLAVIGLWNLPTPWGLAPIGYLITRAIYYRRRFLMLSQSVAHLPASDRPQALREQAATAPLPNWPTRLLTSPLPGMALATYAVTLWWPPPAALTFGALLLAWQPIKRRIRGDRSDQVTNLLQARRGPEGLPTPEI
jgi:hypothetical protein